jgi:hypothetical protein
MCGVAVHSAYGFGPLEHWDHMFKSLLRHARVPTFLCVVLSCDDPTSRIRSPAEMLNGFIVTEVNSVSVEARRTNL